MGESPAKRDESPDPKRYCKVCIERGRDPTAPHHETRANKACPYYIPRMAARNQLKHMTYVTRNVKIGLSTILKATQLLPTIRTFVKRMTVIQLEASRLANLFVLHQLEQNTPIGDMSYNAFMRKVFSAVLRNPKVPNAPCSVSNPKLEGVRDLLYAPQRPVGMPWNDGHHLSQCISLAANGYAANCQNHVILNWESRMLRWWTMQLKTLLPFLHAGQRKHIGRAFLSGREEAPCFAKFNELQKDEIREGYRTLAIDCKANILGTDIPLPVDLEVLSKTWWTLLPPLWRLLRALETGHQRGFTMLPLMGPTAKYVHFDTDAFHHLLRAANIPNVPPNDAKQRETGRGFRSPAEQAPDDCLPPSGEYVKPNFPGVLTCDHWWAWAFKVGKVTTARDALGGTERNAGRRKFACHISTDGLSTSVQVKVERDRWVASTVSLYGFDEDGAYHPLEVHMNDRVIALDPGRISPFTGVYGDSSSETISCSKAEYRQRAAFTEAERTRVRWMKNAPTIERINTAMPTAKTSATVVFQAHLRYVLTHRETLCTFYGAQRWLRLRWKCHIAKEKMWEVMVRRITGGNPRTVVALGDASFAHNSKGHASTPTKGLRRRLLGRCRLRMVDEYRTSITCSLCAGDLPKRTRKWQVKVCSDICLTSWNRDVNAARNIRAIFLHMNAHVGERPECFRRGHVTPA